MSTPRIGPAKVVEFTYFITDEAGEQVERSDVPVAYVHGGRGTLLPKLEKTLSGHGVGDLVEVRISPEDGFGPYRPELTFTDDIDNVPTEFRRVGAEVEMHNEQGDTRRFEVTRIEDGKLTVDGNHPLAGKNLVFTVTVVSIRDATPKEVGAGEPESGQFGGKSNFEF